MSSNPFFLRRESAHCLDSNVSNILVTLMSGHAFFQACSQCSEKLGRSKRGQLSFRPVRQQIVWFNFQSFELKIKMRPTKAIFNLESTRYEFFCLEMLFVFISLCFRTKSGAVWCHFWGVFKNDIGKEGAFARKETVDYHSTFQVHACFLHEVRHVFEEGDVLWQEREMIHQQSSCARYRITLLRS